jgi:hypothetical protein
MYGISLTFLPEMLVVESILTQLVGAYPHSLQKFAAAQQLDERSHYSEQEFIGFIC